MLGRLIQSFKHLKHQNLSTGYGLIQSSGIIYLVLFLANKEVLTLFGNGPSMSCRSRRLFRHLKHQNLFTGLDSIDCSEIIFQFPPTLTPLNQYPHQLIPFDLYPFQTALFSFSYCLSNYIYYIYHTCRDTINQLPSILLLYCIKSEQVMDRVKIFPSNFLFYPQIFRGL